MNILYDKLHQIGWDQKYDEYSTYFEYAEESLKDEKPSLSVIILAWKPHKLIEENLKSLSDQKRTCSFEIIFVDNGSESGAFNALTAYIDTYVRLNKNSGICRGRNLGALFSKSDLLLFLEDDGLPDQELVYSHLMVHRRFDADVVRGACIPITNHPANERPTRYYIGNQFIPAIPHLEGNASYRSEIFFSVNGWNEEIEYGGEGKDLSLRIFRHKSDYTRQIYSPISILYHDMELDEGKLQIKINKMRESNSKLALKYSEWNSYEEAWESYSQHSHLLVENACWLEQPYWHEEFNRLASRVKVRNHSNITSFIEGKIFAGNHLELLKAYETVGAERPICIFGTGALGEKVLRACQTIPLYVSAYADNDWRLWGTDKAGITIYNPANLTANYFVLIASAWRFEIAEQLNSMGLKKGTDYVSIL